VTDPCHSSFVKNVLLLLLGCLAGCGSFEDKRIRELLNEKGFGARAAGDATRENYVGGLDRIQFLMSPLALQTPGYERLVELLAPQPVNVDGTIFVPYVGPMHVLGKTEIELSTLVTAQLRQVLSAAPEVQARILTPGKFFYAFGETGVRGRVPVETDMTLLDALCITTWTPLANLGRVYLIRPDAEHPLVIDVNVREIIVSGDTRANIQVRERDILYVPPTFLGTIARLLQRLLEPVAAAVATVIGVAQVRSAYDIATGETDGVFFRF